MLLTARRLDAALSGRALDLCEIRWPGISPAALVNSTVTGTRAYGKHILTSTDAGWTLHTHLRMDGVWMVSRTGATGRSAPRTAPYVRVLLGNATWTCSGDRLGMVDLVRTRDEHELLDHLGPDILAPDFLDLGLPVALARLRGQAQRPIGEALLDQRPMAGVGTLFAAEGLFEQRVWPWTPAAEVDLEPLVLSIRRHLLRAVVQPITGRLVHVHARAGAPCHRCGGAIVRGESGAPPMSRPMFYCPVCQPPPP